MRNLIIFLILFSIPIYSFATDDHENTTIQLRINLSDSSNTKEDFIVDSFKNYRYSYSYINIHNYLWVQLNNEIGIEKLLKHLKLTYPKLKAIYLDNDLDSTVLYSKLINALEYNQYRVIKYFGLSFPGYYKYSSKLTNAISHKGSASIVRINNCRSEMGWSENISNHLDRKFEPIIELDDTINTIGHKLNLMTDSVCELLYIHINNSKCEYLHSLDNKKEEKEQFIYWLTDSIDLSSISTNSNLRELVIEKPIWDVNLVIDSSIMQSLESFKLKTAYTGSFPKAIYGCKNIKKLSVNMFGFREDYLHLDSFPNLEYLELFNCLELTDSQLKNIIKSKVLKNLKQVTITYSPNTRFLEKVLKKCKALESFETDLYTFARLANYTMFDSTSKPSINNKWVKLLRPLNRISNTTNNLFFFDKTNIYSKKQDMDYYYGTPLFLDEEIGILVPDDSLFKQISLDLYYTSGYSGCICYSNRGKLKTQTNDPIEEIGEKERMLIEYYQKVFRNFTYIHKSYP